MSISPEVTKLIRLMAERLDRIDQLGYKKAGLQEQVGLIEADIQQHKIKLVELRDQLTKTLLSTH
jgi:hypothetical protein